MDTILNLVALAALPVLCWIAFKSIPGLSPAFLGPDSNRSGELDGLRGVLALLILMHHCVIMRAYRATGIYVAPPGDFDNLAGTASVALFFVSSAYLLWGRVLRSGGVLNWPQFYASRLRRLGPMYVAAVTFLVLIVLVESGFRLRVSLGDLLVSIGQWLGFGFFPMSDINALHDTYYIQVVLWTLKYEWQLYLGLPLMALCTSGLRPWLLYGFALVASFGTGGDPLYAYFVAGAVAAHLRHHPTLIPFAARTWAWIGVVALATLAYSFRDVYGLVQVALLLLVFLGATSGAGPWALLRWSALRFLGVISYSIYLLHHMVLHLFSQWVFDADVFARLLGWQFGGVILLIGFVTIILAATTYWLIERPWLESARVRVKRAGDLSAVENGSRL